MAEKIVGIPPVDGRASRSWRGQFGQPTGVLGWAAGHLMAVADKKRNA